jgi:hypothetical protein
VFCVLGIHEEGGLMIAESRWGHLKPQGVSDWTLEYTHDHHAYARSQYVE